MTKRFCPCMECWHHRYHEGGQPCKASQGLEVEVPTNPPMTLQTSLQETLEEAQDMVGKLQAVIRLLDNQEGAG